MSTDLCTGRWKAWTAPQLDGRAPTAFPIAKALATERIQVADVTSAKYVERSYMGADLKRHLGLEISVTVKGREHRYQMYDQHGNMVLSERPIDGGKIRVLGPFVEAVTTRIRG